MYERAKQQSGLSASVRIYNVDINNNSWATWFEE